MSIKYEVISENDIECLRDLCNDLMAFQKSVAHIHTEFFDPMNFDSRLVPAVAGTENNFIVVAKDDDEIVGYAYSTVSPKYTYSGGFATLDCPAFFDFDSVKTEDVGSLSQFFIKEEYRGQRIGSEMFDMSIDWIKTFDGINDIFIFVSNGNVNALKFYQSKGFKISHDILEGFITVMRNN